MIAGCRIYRVLAGLLLAAGLLACAVPAQQDFCPALAAADVTTACYSCYQTRTCSQDETCIRASCCLARCHPACMGGMTGPECDGYSCPCDGSGDDGDLSWIVIVGGAAVLGAGLAGGALVLKGSKGKEKTAAAGKTAPDGKEAIRYILQLSTDHITLAPDTPGRLKVTAWKAVGANPPVPAPEAAITLTVPAGSGLSVQPASGTGSVDAAVAAAAGAAAGRVVITVTASVGKSAESAQVTVEIPAGRYELDVY